MGGEDVMRTPIVAGNWKMNGSIASVDALIQGLLASADMDCELLVCPPSIFLAQVRDRLIAKGRESVIAVGAQDVSQHEAGAYTGEVSASMLIEYGCRYTLIGHSERRQFHAESDIDVAAKVERSLTAGIRPIVCVGETLGKTGRVLLRLCTRRPEQDATCLSKGLFNTTHRVNH